ncbi:galactose-1-epimerase [compost metagenome]
MSPSAIRLTAGDWVCDLRPELGGAITSLSLAGRPVLRPTPEAATILETACFPLIPYANRIADARFEFQGRAASLPVLGPFAPHALHGDGWLNPWVVTAEGEDHVTMRLDWAGGVEGWPWSWSALQAVRLSEAGLRIDLTATNTDRTAQPMGLGLHPYFMRADDARLRLAATGVWLTDEREIPHRLATPEDLIDWSEGVALAEAPFVDHAYAGWTGPARLEGGGRTVLIDASPNAGWVQVYAPRGESFVCVEPVTHRPDAIHAPFDEATGLVVLEPGQSLTMSMTVGVEG